MNKTTDYDIKNAVREIKTGVLNPVTRGSSSAEYGYYEYLPPVYLQNNQQFPLILFLHGAGEVGDSRSDPDILKRVKKHGIPFLISKNQWKPDHPFLVLSPQNHVYGWDPDGIHRFLNYIYENYSVDRKRVYITGISMGGFGIFSYLCRYGEQSGVAAAVPICGGGDTRCAGNIKNIPIWAFHGEADNVVNVQYSIGIINAVNKLKPPVKARITIFPRVKHNSWTMTYSGAGMGKESGKYDKFDMMIWEWMYQFELR